MSSVLPRFFPKLFVVSPLRLTVSEYRSVALMTMADSSLMRHPSLLDIFTIFTILVEVRLRVKDLSRNAISQKDARKAKDYVRDLLYDALRDADTSVEAFEESVSSENVYQRCGITRTANPRGRPPKKKAGEQS